MNENRVVHTDQMIVSSDRSAYHANVGDRQALLTGLNEDFAAENQAIELYTLYAAMLTGSFRQELQTHILTDIGDDQRHARFLSDKITALGGRPLSKPQKMLGLGQSREILNQILMLLTQSIASRMVRIQQAQQCGELSLKIALENQLKDETRHLEKVQQLIAGWEQLYLERTETNIHKFRVDGRRKIRFHPTARRPLVAHHHLLFSQKAVQSWV